ncbi:MAG: hypothetical protein AB1430_17245 [Pseudomonadota bacterium]
MVRNHRRQALAALLGLGVLFGTQHAAAQSSNPPAPAAPASAAAPAAAVSRHLAPGFQRLDAGAKLAVVPIDVQLFSISAGGVVEPRADWSEAANRHMRAALDKTAQAHALESAHLDGKLADEHAEVMNLHAAVAGAISMHHFGFHKLPTKEDKLDWSFGDALRPLQQATGARYGLFVYMRDSYASAERKAMMGVVAVLSAVATGGASVAMLGGGMQTGYATLVDLQTGQVLWFNQLLRTSGDLREEAAAVETMSALLTGFPGSK